MDPSQAREYERRAIDAKIKYLEDLIRELKYRRNAFATISSLPVEVIQGIFSYSRSLSGTSSPLTQGKKPDPIAWLRVTHVCRHWREIAFNQPLFWSQVDFTDLRLAGAAEILTRAKTVPLFLEARVHASWTNTRIAVFREMLQRHISHIRHLDISAIPPLLHQILERLVSPAPTLEYLSLSGEKVWPRTSPLPHTLFNRTAPKLSRLELYNYDISWRSPLLKGLSYLDIRSPSRNARPRLATWLDSLKEMSQLKTLILHSASPIAPGASPPFDIKRTITLPSLTHLDISASPWDGALALAHLHLPALAELVVATRSRNPGNDEVQGILPYIALHSHGPHPLQSMLIYTQNARVDILAWTVPDIDFDVRDSSVIHDAMLSARVMLSVTSDEWSATDTHTRMIDGAMTTLPLDNLVTLTAPDYTLLDEQVWQRHAPRWQMLQCVRLGVVAARGFRRILLEDNGKNECSMLPSLIKLILVDSGSVSTGPWILDICDVVIKRLEQGVPLEEVDMRACGVASHAAIEQLTKLGVDVWGPTEENSKTQKPSFATYYSHARGLLFPDNSTGLPP